MEAQLLAAVLADELCYRVPVEELTEERIQEFAALAREYLAGRQPREVPEDVELACQQLLPGLIELAGVSEHPTEALYPTSLYQGLKRTGA